MRVVDVACADEVQNEEDIEVYGRGRPRPIEHEMSAVRREQLAPPVPAEIDMRRFNTRHDRLARERRPRREHTENSYAERRGGTPKLSPAFCVADTNHESLGHVAGDVTRPETSPASDF